VNVTLAYLAKPVTGGWVSYTAHLARGLRAAGHTVSLVKLGNRTENHERDFGMGLMYRNMSAAGLDVLARTGRMIITAVDKSAGPELTAELRDAGAALVIHDPTELKGGMRDAVDHGGAPLWVIRRTMLRHLPHARYMPHPYVRCAMPPRTGRRYHAASFARLDWDKRTDLMVMANLALPPEHRIRIHGAENRLYTHHKLDALDPDWRTYYTGPMHRSSLWAGVRVARFASYAVDLSVIKGDGGGTQYTFLEALDAGSQLVINKAWLTGDSMLDEMAPYAHPVANAEDLVELLKGPLLVGNDVRPVLWDHDAQMIAERMIKEWV
jgi:hypothetical protein